ncbi:MAG: hypothetical protein K9G58_09925 [Bacteroidales bacterium]|nr:hypothetical protein [Bacteroidales bacterium]MCF8388094.1 hypothetical protein [Bacteroidales bacterium]MCF8398477.1 hypothetical protein [Bacteroidales bacterium]
MKTNQLLFFTSLVLVMLCLSCDKNKEDSELIIYNEDVTGCWEFTLSPGELYFDTAIVKGHSSCDFEYYASVNDQVYLYQNKQGALIGYSGPFRLSGFVNGKNIILDVYDHPNGNYIAGRPVDEMFKYSKMELSLDDFGLMSGTGTYYANEGYPDIVKNTYIVSARKLNALKDGFVSGPDFKNIMEVGNWEDDICKVIFSIGSWVLSTLTDGVIRTMSSDCWLHKDGGGYYAFGHEGPGSLFPVLTQSVYYPLEWSACGVRKYGFTISLEGESISYEVLKNSIINSPPVKDLFSKLGFSGIPELEAALDDFHNEFGGFGISVFYDTHTHNLGLYVNHTKGSNEAAKNSNLVQGMKAAFDKLSGTVYVFAGSSIHDEWHLRRSDFVVCNTPILIGYVLGTHKVNYN